MKINKFLALLLFVPLIAHCTCYEDSIKTISDKGGIIITESSAVYRVFYMDKNMSKFWNVADDIFICGDNEIVDKDSNREQVSVMKL